MDFKSVRGLAETHQTDEFLGKGTKQVLTAQYFAPQSALMAAGRVYLSSSSSCWLHGLH